MKILAVDDNKMERFFLITALSRLGYDIVEAVNGHDALAMLDSQDISIVISDWMMPGMDGIELCRRIRARKSSNGYIYVIMVTSRSEQEDLMKGFEAGVDAYLQKPITVKVLDVQIKVGVRIVNLERQLTSEKQKVAMFAHEMETLADQRAKQLVHADRMATLGVLAAGIAHEINNPATFINGNIQTFEKFWKIIRERLDGSNEEKDEKKEGQTRFIIDEMPGLIDGIKSGTKRIQRIVGGLKSYARQESPESAMSNIHRIIEEALLLCHNSLKYNVTVEKHFAWDLPLIFCDPQQIEQVLVNIFNNGADAMEKMEGGTITISTSIAKGASDEEFVVISVEDSGPGLSRDALDSIWNPFFTTKPVGKGTGLGMSISHGIIKSHGGTIKAENRDEGGAKFTISLPVSTKK